MVRVTGNPEEIPSMKPSEGDLTIRKIENGHSGTRVSDHTTQQRVSSETIISLQEIDPSKISQKQKHILEELDVIAKGTSQDFSLLSQIEESNVENQVEESNVENQVEESNVENQDFVLDFLEQSHTQIALKDSVDLSSTLSMPSLVSSLYGVLKWLNYMKDIPGLTFGLQEAGAVAATLAAAIDMDQNMAVDAKHRNYGKELTPLKVQLVKGTIESPGEDKKDVLLPTDKASKQLESLIEKRQKTHKSRLEKEELSFDRYLKELTKSGPHSLDSLPRLLKKRGIDLKKLPDGESIQTLEDLKVKLKKVKLKDPVFKKLLLEQIIRYKDGMTTTAKNILRETLLDNQKVNQKLFSWKLLQSKINFSASVFIGASTIILASLVFAGLSIAFFPLMIPTLVGVALGAGLALAGLIILAKNKPNLLKEVLMGTKIKLAFHELPRAFNAWRLKVNQAELQANNAALLQFLEARPITLEGLKAFRDQSIEDIPPALLDFYNHLQKKKELSIKDLKKFEIKENELLAEGKKLSGVVENYKQQLKFYEDKVKGIQDRLDEARAKDFARNTNFNVKDLELVAEGLVEGEFWQDEEAVKFMKSNLDIDLEPLRNRYVTDKSKEQLKAVLDKKMRNAILQNSTQLIEWLKKRDI